MSLGYTLRSHADFPRRVIRLSKVDRVSCSGYNELPWHEK